METKQYIIRKENLVENLAHPGFKQNIGLNGFPKKTVSNVLEGGRLYEPLTTHKIAEYIKLFEANGEYSFLDIGAYIGYFSVICANLSKKCKIYAFEPFKETFDVLVENLKNYSNCESYCCGISSDNTEQIMYVHKHDYACNSFDKHLLKPVREEKVQVKTIDSFGIDFFKPVIAKIDVEGWEYIILKNLSSNLKRGDIVFVENNHRKDLLKSTIEKCRYKHIGGCELNMILEKE